VSKLHLSRINRGWAMRSHEHVSAAEFAEAIASIRAGGGGSVRWFVHQPTPEEVSAATQHGLQREASLLYMRCALPLGAQHQAPADFVTRPFRPGHDNHAWLALNSRAFAAHPEQGDWTLEVLAERLDEPWFDANGFFIYEVAGVMAGFCWTKVHDHTHAHDSGHGEPEGEIFVIGVDPAHHGKGLGRALTITGFAHLAAAGLRHGMLYVAGNNTAAIKLYESLGMSTADGDDVFVGVVSQHA
jgi:mycothiol synthase